MLDLGDKNLLFGGAPRWPLFRAARPPRAGRPARPRGARARGLPPPWGGVEYLANRRGLSRGKTGERRTPGGRAGQTTATSGADSLLSRALGGLPDHVARPVAERTATGTPRQADCGRERARGPCLPSAQAERCARICSMTSKSRGLRPMRLRFPPPDP